MCKSLHSELSMRFLALILALGSITCPQGGAQAPPAAPPNPGQQTTAVPTAQPQPGDTGAAPLALTFQDPLARARTTNQQYLSATTIAQLSHADREQAKAARKTRNAQQSLREAEQIMDITRKQEGGGEVAHSDVVKAQIQLEQRQRDAQEARLNEEKSRIALAVLLFPDFRRDFTAVDD